MGGLLGRAFVDLFGEERRAGRKAEVEHFDVAGGCDLDVGRLQIAMDDPLVVRGFEGVGDLTGVFQRIAQREGPLCDALGERLTRDQRQDERPDAVAFFHAVNRCDVRMIECGEQPRLALEAGEPFGLVRVRRRAAP